VAPPLAPTASAAPPAASAASAKAGPEARGTFPPPPFDPPVQRTAAPEDGKWAPLVAGAAGAPAVLYRSTVHPHKIKPHVYVAVVAVDLSRVGVKLVAGRDEPESDAVPKAERTGLIPAADQDELIAVFNGGFKTRHGKLGMRIGAATFVPPREDACTIGLGKDGSVAIASWPRLRDREGELAAWRQTPPCLLEAGALDPRLDADEVRKPRVWGASEQGEVEIRRSAVGVDATGRTLFYGLGEWTTARALADAMKAAGSVTAAELDINWSYTFFLLYGSEGGAKVVTSTLVPKIKHARDGYVRKFAYRDFFYLVHE
jgi:hypothetical protein